MRGVEPSQQDRSLGSDMRGLSSSSKSQNVGFAYLNGGSGV